MELTVKNWNGFVQGTNTGKIALNLEEVGVNPKGVLRVQDDVWGVVLYKITGETSNDSISFTGVPDTNREDITVANITIACNLTPEGNLKGTWSSEIGTGGTFVAYPFHESAAVNVEQLPPEQIFTKRVQLGFVQLYKADIQSIEEYMRQEFVGKQVIVTYQAPDKPERINYFGDFIQSADVGSLSYLKLFVSEPERQGINRSITIELRSFGANELMVQGMTESWVLGRSQMTADFLKKYQDKIRNFVNKFLPALSLVVLLGMLIWMTTMDTILGKLSVGCVAFMVLYALPRIFMWLLPNALIQIGEEKPNIIKKFLRKGGSWILAAIIIFITTIINQYAEITFTAIQAALDTLISGNSGNKTP